MEITIRKADAADLDAVVRVYEHVHDAEEAGPAQVGLVRGVYPVRSTAEAALERGDLFVEEADGAVVGTGIFNRLQADVYAGAPWQYDAPDDQIMVLHTLAVDPQAGNGALAAPSPHFTSSTPGSMAAGICASTPTRELKHYTLQMIIAVGFKVNNPRAV